MFDLLTKPRCQNFPQSDRQTDKPTPRSSDLEFKKFPLNISFRLLFCIFALCFDSLSEMLKFCKISKVLFQATSNISEKRISSFALPDSGMSSLGFLEKQTKR